MNTVNIRSYKKDDYLGVKETLIEGILFEESWDVEERLSRRIEEKPDSIIVAVVANEIVGCIYLYDDILPFVFRLAVKKQFRRQGIGTMLLEEAAHRLKQHGHKEIALLVDNDNEELKNWYRKQHFQETKSLWKGFWKRI